jgi:hypothetical protein
MQRLFSMFPSGWPGIALVMLRVAVAFPLVLDVYGTRRLPVWAATVLVVLSIALFIGAFTPLAASLSLLRLLGPSSATYELAAVSVLTAAALTLLGPGAYSLDMVRFGRRVVVLPTDEDAHRD